MPQWQDASAPALIGYVDGNRDGINDRFSDADGDGIDDISAKPYPHRFRFVDEDGDGIDDARLLRPKSGLRPTMLDQADPKLEKRRLQRLRRYDPEREKRKRGGRN